MGRRAVLNGSLFLQNFLDNCWGGGGKVGKKRKKKDEIPKEVVSYGTRYKLK